MTRLNTLLSAAATITALSAQNPCEGNGPAHGSGYLTTTPAIVGGTLELHLGSPAAPNALGLLLFSAGAPGTPLCFDLTGFIASFAVVTDGAGDALFTVPVPFGLFGSPPLFAKGVVLESPTAWSITKTVRVSVENANSTRSLPPPAAQRSLHSATAFAADPRDNRTGVLVAGGASGSMIQPIALATTEVFEPLSRTWQPGPAMALPRSCHRAVRLLDGRILITGGMTNGAGATFGGPATASCEIYSPATNTLAPTGSMLQARMGHGLTVLTDGRVLATGGLTDWTDPGPNFVARLGSGTNTTEIWDPATGQWTAGPAMNTPRSGHGQTLLGNGEVLIVGGVISGTTHPISGWGTIEVPVFTGLCQRFVPATNTFAPVPQITLARGWHGQSLLANGNVLVTGGAASVGAYMEAAATSDCQIYDVAANTWTAAALLPFPVAFHTQVTDPRTGNAWIAGGYIGNFASLQAIPQVLMHGGAAVTTLADLGTNPGAGGSAWPTAAHSATLLHDGTMLVVGGYDGVTQPLLPPAGLLIAP